MITRRRFVTASAVIALTPKLRIFAQSKKLTMLMLYPERIGPAVPQDFFGLSYETEQLAEPDFFSRSNKGLVAKFRALTPHGVLRIGGDTSDVGWWKATPKAKQPPLPENVVLFTRPGHVPPMDLSFPVTPEAVRNLRGFLDATGWTTIYGINMGTNTPERAAEEATFVAKTLGSRLDYFQIGNEPQGYERRLRDKAKWNPNIYMDEWLAMANAIRARVKTAKFGLPDGILSWAKVAVDRLVALPQGDRPNVVAITNHYYFTGPPSNPHGTIENLLKTDRHIPSVAEEFHTTAGKVGAKYRMTEGNTCYGGGKPGLSDVFASALWAADYTLNLALVGYAGANLHGGSGKIIRNGLGGRLTGEALITDPSTIHPRPFYAPIAEIGGKYVAEPVYYGLKFAQYFAGATMIGVDFDPGSVNATAYAAKLPNGKTLIAIINKDATQVMEIDVTGFRKGVLYRLTAPAIDSCEAHLSGFGNDNVEQLHSKSGDTKLSWSVPAASAALFESL